jgi:hypothetical protein
VFPPKPTPNYNELLNNLVQSVGRAGPVFTGNATQAPDGEGYRFTLQLLPGVISNTPVGERVQKYLAQYMRAYARESGWRVKAVSFKRGYVAFAVAPSRARSSASRNW